MSRIVTLIFLIILIPIMVVGQSNDIVEIEVEKIDTNSNKSLLFFYQKFNTWVDNVERDSIESNYDESRMVNNFVIFSEDGLLMKDLSFHSIEACQRKILEDLPKQSASENEKKWMLVTLESHLNRIELINILDFLREHQIEYVFGQEEVIVSKFIKH